MYRLKVWLLGSYPNIWRQVSVHSSTDLHSLHLILQALFEWEGGHVHMFGVALPEYAADASLTDMLYGEHNRVFGDGYGLLDRQESEESVTVGEVLPAVGDRMVYEYDTGDSWDHAIEVEAIEPATAANSRNLPRCTGGENAAPGDDTGGIDRHRWMVQKYRKEKGLLTPAEIESMKRREKEDDEEEEEEDEREEKEDLAEDSEEEDDDDDEHDLDYHETVKGWLEGVSGRLGHKYDPLHFDQRRANLVLKSEFHKPAQRAGRTRS